MRIARLRALTQSPSGTQGQSLPWVEMRIARLRALTQPKRPYPYSEKKGRNENRPIKGIDTQPSQSSSSPFLSRRNENRPIKGIDTLYEDVQLLHHIPVEMSIARLRALTLTLNIIYFSFLYGRNEYRPIKGIDTQSVHLYCSTLRQNTVEMSIARLRALTQYLALVTSSILASVQKWELPD